MALTGSSVGAAPPALATQVLTTALVASAWTGDWDLWKYGAQAVEDREVARRLRIFAKEVGGFALKIAALERQHGMSFYNYRVAQSSQVYMPPPFRAA